MGFHKQPRFRNSGSIPLMEMYLWAEKYKKIPALQLLRGNNLKPAFEHGEGAVGEGSWGYEYTVRL